MSNCQMHYTEIFLVDTTYSKVLRVAAAVQNKEVRDGFRALSHLDSPRGKEWAFHFSHIEQILIISIQSERRSLLIIEPSFLVLSHFNSSRGARVGENGLLTCVQYTIS